VFSAHRPGPRLLEAVLAARSAGADRIVVVDDGTPDDATSAQAVLARVEAEAELVRLSTNSGIAAALNRGIEAVLGREDVAAIVTLDQDTVLRPHDLEGLLDALERAERTSLHVAGAAPAFMGPRAFPTEGTRDGCAILSDPIQSGMLVRPAVYRSVGLLREDFFIDAVDTEFALRCRARGMVFVAADQVSLDHSLGHARPITVLGRSVSILGRPRSFAQHSPVRTYYMARNAAVLRRVYGSTPAVSAKSRSDLFSFALSLVYGPSRLRQLRAMAAGLRDARRGRLGPLPERRLSGLVPRRDR